MDSSSALSTHRTLMRVAFAIANAFAWIFVFQYFASIHSLAEALARTAVLYAIVYAITVLVIPYAARRLRHGMKRGVIFGAVLAILALAVFAATFAGTFGAAYVYGISVFALLLGLYRAVYRVPYSVEAAEYPVRSFFLMEILIALTPAVAGASVASGAVSPSALIAVATAILCAALVPLARVRDVYERFSWGYRETFDKLVARAHAPAFSRAVLDGIQSGALFLLWPIAIFLIVGWSYALLGAVLSITLLIAHAVRMPARSFARRFRIRDVSVFYAVVAMSAWIGRVLVATPVGIVLVDTYFHTGTAGREGMDVNTFDQTADGGFYVDEYTALKEMGLGIGRIIVCVVAAGTALTSSVSVALLVAFALAACAAGGSVWIVHRAAEHRRVI